jgi:hypothetical protein
MKNFTNEFPLGVFGGAGSAVVLVVLVEGSFREAKKPHSEKQEMHHCRCFSFLF